MVTSPTFWLKEVTGGHPKRPEMVLAKPSQARDPEISFSVTLRFSPVAQRAEVSPMVSAAETRKIIATDTIAPICNSGITGIKAGRERKPPSKIPEKSTTPIKAAKI